MPKINRGQTGRKIHPKGILKEWPPSHCYSDGKGGLWTHTGTGAECQRPECVAEREPAPWGYSDPRPDPLGTCPVYGRHRWLYGDDGNGHSGAVCECGASEV